MTQSSGVLFERLLEIMQRLRGPDGCPWDREQTPTSLKAYLIEEAYEVLEAIEANDAGALREELGDLLLQVVFHAQIAAEIPNAAINNPACSIGIPSDTEMSLSRPPTLRKLVATKKLPAMRTMSRESGIQERNTSRFPPARRSISSHRCRTTAPASR